MLNLICAIVLFTTIKLKIKHLREKSSSFISFAILWLLYHGPWFKVKVQILNLLADNSGLACVSQCMVEANA